MSALVRFLTALFLIWLFRPLAAAIWKVLKKEGPKADHAASAKHMVKDPVCGMYMDSRLAVRLESGKDAFYFCSEECKNRYLGKSAEEGIGSNGAG
jgi:uncharacterized protein